MKKSFFQTPVLASLLFVLSLTGCGYTQQTVLPNNIQSIYVDTVRNSIPVEEINSYVPGLEINITNAIIRRFNIDGNLRVVGNREEADAILEADLMQFQQEGVRFTGLERVEEYRLFIVINMKLLDREENVILEESNFSGDTEFFVSEVRSISREDATHQAVRRLARNVVDRIVEDW